MTVTFITQKPIKQADPTTQDNLPQEPVQQQSKPQKIAGVTFFPGGYDAPVVTPAAPTSTITPEEPGFLSNFSTSNIVPNLRDVRDWLVGAPAPAPVPQTAEQQLQPPPPDQAARRAQLETQLPIRPDWPSVIAENAKQSLVGKLITGGLEMLPQQTGPQQFGGMGPRPVKPQLENATGAQKLVGGAAGFLPDLGPIGAISKGARALGAGRAAAGALGFGYTEAAKGGIDVLRGDLPITQLPEHVAKSAVMGGVLGKLGQLPALKGAIAEMGAMAGLPGLMEGRMPTAEEVGAGFVYPLAFRAPGAIRAFLTSRGVPPEIATVAERELLQLEYKPQPIEMPTREQQARDNTARVMDEIARATEAGRIERGVYARPPEPPEPQIQIPTTRFEQPPEVPQVPIPRSESGLRAIPVQPPNREARRARTEAGLEPSVQANNPLDVIGWLAQQFNRTPYAREVKELMPDKKMEEIRFLIRKYNQEKGQPVQTPSPKEPVPTQAAQTPEQAVPSLSISAPEKPTAEVPSRDRSQQGREVLGQEREGQELGRPVQVQGESPEAPTTDRVLQAPERKVAPTPVAEQPAPVTPQTGPERAAQSTVPANIQKQYDTYQKRMADPNVTPAVKRVTQGQIDRIEQQYPGVKTPYGKYIATGRTEQQGLLDKINQAYEQTGKLSPQEVDMRVDELVRTGKADAKLRNADQATKRHAVSEPELARIWQEHVESAKGKQGPAKASAIDTLVNAVMEMPRRIATAIAKLHNVDWKGSTKAIKDRIVKEIRKLLGEEIGAARNPFERDDKIVPFPKKENIPNEGSKFSDADTKALIEYHLRRGETDKTYKDTAEQMLWMENSIRASKGRLPLVVKDGTVLEQGKKKPTGEIKRLFSEETGAARIPGSGKDKESKSSVRSVLEGIRELADSQKKKLRPGEGPLPKKSSMPNKSEQARMDEILEDMNKITEGTLEEGGRAPHRSVEEIKAIGDTGMAQKGLVEPIVTGTRDPHRTVKEHRIAQRLVELQLDRIESKIKDIDEGRISLKEGHKQVIEYIQDKIISTAAEVNRDAAQALRISGAEVTPRRSVEMAKLIQDAILNMRGKITKAQYRQLQRLLSGELTSQEQVVLVSELRVPKLTDYLTEFMYSNMMASFVTQGVNALNTSVQLSLLIPERAVQGAGSAIWSGIRQVGAKLGIPNTYVRTKYMREVVDLLRGAPTGFKEGIPEAISVLRRNAPTKVQTRQQQEMAGKHRAWENSPYRAARALAPAVSLFSRTARASDTILVSAALEMEGEAILTRKAIELSKRANVSIAKARQQIIDNPGPILKAQIEKLREETAQTYTYNNAPNGFIHDITSIRNRAGFLGHWFVPFINTTANMMGLSVEYTPGLGLAKQALGHGMGVTKQGYFAQYIPANELFARQVIGTGMAALGGMLWSMGLMTGKGPEDPKQRQVWEKFNQADSFWVGNKDHIGEKGHGVWISAYWLGPLAVPMLMTARTLEAVQRSRQEDKERLSDEWIQNAAWETAGAYRDYLVNSTYMRGVLNILGYDSKNEEFSDVAIRTANRMVGQLIPATGLMPAIDASWRFAQGDEKLRDAMLEGTGVSKKDFDNWYDPLLGNIPGNSIPPKMDAFGRKVPLPGGMPRMWLPVYWTTPSDDPADIEIDRLRQKVGWVPGLPNRNISLKIGTQKVKNYYLDNDVYRGYTFRVGSEFKDWLDKRIATSYYKRLSDEEKMKDIKRNLDIIRKKWREGKVSEVVRQRLLKEGKITASEAVTLEDL